jgi:hypothetical protein
MKEHTSPEGHPPVHMGGLLPEASAQLPAVGVGVGVSVFVRVGVHVKLGVAEGVAVNVGGLTGHWTSWICPVRTPLRSMPVGV